MSFLMVSGKINVCENCKKALQIEYEGGQERSKLGMLIFINLIYLIIININPRRFRNGQQ